MANGGSDVKKAGIVATIGAAVIASFITGRITKADDTTNSLTATKERVTALENRLDRKDAQDKEFRAALQSSVEGIRRDMNTGLMEIRNKLDRQTQKGSDR